MITADQQRSWFQQLVKQGSTNLPGLTLDWLERAREDAREAVAELPALNRKQEAWRYSSIEGLLGSQFQATTDLISGNQSLDIEPWLLPSLDSYRLVFVNGRCAPNLSNIQELPDGVTLASLRATLTTDPELLNTWFGQTANHTEHLFTALNSALVNDGVFIHIDRDIELDRPIEVIYLNLDQTHSLLTQPRNLVVMENHSRATLIERFVCSEPSLYFHNNLTEIVVRQRASLNHYRIQEESRNAYHMSSLYLSQERDSHYQGTTLAFGGTWARTDYNVQFRQQGAECTLNGLYSAGDGQLTDFHLNVLHNVPGCSSRERFKGILYGKGRAVFDGRILVGKDAQKSDAHLTNDNLMLSRSAEVDTKPQLEIYADDVKCSHGTTIGQLDPEQIFYLRSRGIDESTAKKMLSIGFATEIIDTIAEASLRIYAAERLSKILDLADTSAEEIS